jgi:uncharacterized protein YjbI with pentapeptide repeats
MPPRHRPGSARPRGAHDLPRLPDALVTAAVDLLGDDGALEGVRCDGGDVAGRSIEGLALHGADLVGCRFTGATLSGLDLLDVVLRDCDLSGASLAGAVLRRVTFERCRLSGLVANDLSASHVRISDCRADGAWLRAARFEHCDIADCEFTESDWYGAEVRRSRIVRTRLDGSELSTAVFADVALHGSSLAAVRGAALRDVVIGSDQVIDVAVAVFGSFGIVIDDEADPGSLD